MEADDRKAEGARQADDQQVQIARRVAFLALDRALDHCLLLRCCIVSAPSCFQEAVGVNFASDREGCLPQCLLPRCWHNCALLVASEAVCRYKLQTHAVATILLCVSARGQFLECIALHHVAFEFLKMSKRSAFPQLLSQCRFEVVDDPALEASRRGIPLQQLNCSIPFDAAAGSGCSFQRLLAAEEFARWTLCSAERVTVLMSSFFING
jgi:hypothetical protein